MVVIFRYKNPPMSPFSGSFDVAGKLTYFIQDREKKMRNIRKHEVDDSEKENLPFQKFRSKCHNFVLRITGPRLRVASQPASRPLIE